MMKLQLLQKGILRYMTSFNVLKNNMEELALTKMLEILPNVIDKSTKNKTSLVDSLLELTNGAYGYSYRMCSLWCMFHRP